MMAKTNVIATALSLATFLRLLAPTKATAGGAFIKTQWEPVAEFAQSMRKVTPAAIQLLDDIDDYLHDFRRRQYQLTVYITAKNSRNETEEYGPIAAALSSLIDQLETKSKQGTKAVVAAVANAEFMRVHMPEFLKIAKSAYTDASKGCLETGDNTNVISTIATDTVNEDAIVSPKTQPKNTDLSAITADGLKDLTVFDGLEDKDLPTSSDCELWSGQQAVLWTAAVDKQW
ncbi:Trypanosome variant surface glycoprotein (A-type) [Trypanosoma brucei equiperdum]|uniref:Trypanosome variant surface glycoprotein (A-type) n=1 Tax=Trypanosoma brucei equiperdum TaxID=630700 RepID=A0A3L6L6Z0_9TRYP|nr:Trypanosome variant surface glycoprotein (A-type) [Trypanosoma brucei equiperdum]RHW71995.1 Trypanosome variant surface glycoprotein (A-type) [Trypanosoma brucei equiperdum]RHW72278.1 Trypanosome variant surface glycoprotein (A-type) [Trypanosoma brucei equiperdum]